MTDMIITVDTNTDYSKMIDRIETLGVTIVATIENFRVLLCRGKVESLKDIEGITVRFSKDFEAIGGKPFTSRQHRIFP